ncbi:leucine-rich repeat-containing protein 2 isoform X3 [Conger conger]|uniref:leucine-rich repeat-containing protein 2 isoform X3 n=1 Tax=Conger conger TaxID=82655 RepID=UPI002A5AD93A|nr:leucine-rich repeat-containing protein 2 isoform X3 [Conger conger]
MMRVSKGLDIPVYDLSFIRGLWEGRVKKYRQRQKKEQERQEKSALVKLNQQWHYRLECRTMKVTEITELQQYLERKTLSDTRNYDGISTLQPCQKSCEADSAQKVQIEEQRFIFELDDETRTELPDYIQDMTHLRQWHIRGTRIQKIPKYIERFQELQVLDVPKNGLEELPEEIGKLVSLKELNVSYNKLSNIPPELGECEKLERLEVIANLDIKELPFELSNLKKLTYLDLSANKLSCIPVCVLRMSSLQWLDISNNLLTDLPQDIDSSIPNPRLDLDILDGLTVKTSSLFKLEELTTLFLHKNKLTYLPMELTNISTLKMIIVSGDLLVCLPSKLCDDPAINGWMELKSFGDGLIAFPRLMGCDYLLPDVLGYLLSSWHC